MYLIMSIMIVVLMLILLMSISYKNDKEGESVISYECGFEPISKARVNFSYRFFLLSILFLVFDVEIILFLLIPYMKLMMMSVLLFILMMWILVFGLVYEWMWGSLNWI